MLLKSHLLVNSFDKLLVETFLNFSVLYGQLLLERGVFRSYLLINYFIFWAVRSLLNEKLALTVWDFVKLDAARVGYFQ